MNERPFSLANCLASSVDYGYISGCTIGVTYSYLPPHEDDEDLTCYQRLCPVSFHIVPTRASGIPNLRMITMFVSA
jgi:hypothetical protein